MATGYVFDPRFLAHDTGAIELVRTAHGTFRAPAVAHPSAAAITRSIHAFITRSGLIKRLKRIPARAATSAELTAIHDPAYIDAVRQAAATGNHDLWQRIADEDTPISLGTYAAAILAAGGALAAVEAVAAARVANAYALLRPPGHHATRNQSLGYCIFNNAAIAARYAQQTLGLGRIMIVDWDAHHGNGTQEAFYADPSVLFISIHQQHWFPGDGGTLAESGEGAGTGYTINIPLPPGTGDQGYAQTFARIVLPIGRQFRPDLIIVSAGQDASFLDPLARLMLTTQGFRTLAQMVNALAEEVCDGRLVLLQEGGYSASYVPYSALAMLEPLAGIDLGIVDPESHTREFVESTRALSQDTLAAIEQAVAWHRQWWDL